MPYSALSSVYDRFVGADYDAIAALVASILNAFDVKGKVLDVACGTGELTSRLKASGFEVSGTDASDEMLEIAKAKCNAYFFKSDMCSLPQKCEFEACVCTLDSLNHLNGKDSLRQAFESINGVLKPGGVFIFDMNTLFKHREILADNTFVYEDESSYVVWQNSATDDGRVDISLDIFSKLEEGNYKRQTESFSEYAYELSVLKDMLTDAEFEIVDISSGFEMEEIDDECERYFFIVRKI